MKESQISFSNQEARNEIASDDNNEKQPTNRIITILHHLRERLDWSLVWMILAIKGLIFLYAAESYHILTDKQFESWRGWFDIWNRRDSIYKVTRYFDFNQKTENIFTNLTQ